MNQSYVAFYIVVSLFSIYALFCSAECGIALIRLFPKLSAKPAAHVARFLPLWEVTNVFLVFGFTGFAVLFSNALVQISSALLPVLVVALVSLLLRACLVLYLFYHQGKMGPSFSNTLFLIANFVIPLSFAAAGFYLISGQYFWQQTSGWLVMLNALLALAITGLSFAAIGARGKQSGPLATTITVLVGIWSLFSNSLLFMNAQFLAHMLPRIEWLPLFGAAALIGSGVIMATKRLSYAWVLASAVTFVQPLFIAWAAGPYLSYPAIRVEQAFSAHGFFNILLLGLAISLPLIAAGIGLLVKLLTQPTFSETERH